MAIRWAKAALPVISSPLLYVNMPTPQQSSTQVCTQVDHISGRQSNRPRKAPTVVIAAGRVSSQAPSPTVVREAGRAGFVSEVHL